LQHLRQEQARHLQNVLKWPSRINPELTCSKKRSFIMIISKTSSQRS